MRKIIMKNDGVYIAGPMRGCPEFNFPAFHLAERFLRACGNTNIFNPAQNAVEVDNLDTTGMVGEERELENVGYDMRAAIKRDLIFICEEAYAIYMLHGWEHSAGARVEHSLAVMLGLKIIYQKEWR
jgi:hypothetical protein